MAEEDLPDLPEEVMIVSEFSFTVPECPPGATLKIPAPDGVKLHVPLPRNVIPGDRMHMVRDDEDRWIIKNCVRDVNEGEQDGAPLAAAQASCSPIAPPAVLASPCASTRDLDAERKAVVEETSKRINLALQSGAAAARRRQEAADAEAEVEMQRARAAADAEARRAEEADAARRRQEAANAEAARRQAAVEPDRRWSTQVLRRSPTSLAADLARLSVTVRLDTTRGAILLRIVPSWAPLGAQRFLQLVDDGYYEDIAIYRAVPKFLIQFGIVRDPPVCYQPILDDPLRGVPIEDGSVLFAAKGPNTRRATLCIFLGDFPQLGRSPWETPIGKVRSESMQTFHAIYTGYGDIPQCGGRGPDPLKLEEMGNDYITQTFPDCDYVTGASRVK